VAAAGAWGQAQKAPPPSAYLAWVGTYSRGKSKGIYAYRWKPPAGKYAEKSPKSREQCSSPQD
jgi:hypothetical protein